MVATGSNPKIWKLLQHLGHKIVDPVPSLFTFNCSDSRISGIPGVSTQAHIQVFSKNLVKSKINVPLKSNVSKNPLLTSEGPVLITHWGLSGPAILRLSAWGARILNELSYQFTVEVNWAPEYTYEGLLGLLTEVKTIEGKKTVARTKALDIPKRLWSKLVSASSIDKTERWADVNKNQLTNLTLQLTQCELTITGKSTFKEEFVTAGGVDLKEVDFKSCKSKLLPNLYFAGEVMNIDAITGGFNFQNAWTSAHLVAKAITAQE